MIDAFHRHELDSLRALLAVAAAGVLLVMAIALAVRLRDAPSEPPRPPVRVAPVAPPPVPRTLWGRALPPASR